MKCQRQNCNKRATRWIKFGENMLYMCKEHYEKERDALRKMAFWCNIGFSDGKIQKEVKKDEVRRVRRKRSQNIRLQNKPRQRSIH